MCFLIVWVFEIICSSFFLFFCSHGGVYSRGILVVFEAPGAPVCTFGVLWLLCEAPASQSRQAGKSRRREAPVDLASSPLEELPRNTQIRTVNTKAVTLREPQGCSDGSLVVAQFNCDGPHCCSGTTLNALDGSMAVAMSRCDQVVSDCELGSPVGGLRAPSRRAQSGIEFLGLKLIECETTHGALDRHHHHHNATHPQSHHAYHAQRGHRRTMASEGVTMDLVGLCLELE